MRIAIIADIHANLVSFEAVLADIEQERVDQTICLGDLATIGPQPKAVLQRMKELGYPCVIGNHESWLLNLNLLDKLQGAPHWFTESIRWCATQLSEDDLEFMRSFPPTISLPLEGKEGFLGFHGSPSSDMDSIYPMTPPEELEQLLAGHTFRVMAGAHTHAQMLRQHKGMLIINPGSVGMPFDQAPTRGPIRFHPWAEYAILSATNGVLSVDMRRVSIDLVRVKNALTDDRHPAHNIWLNNWKK